MNDNIINLTDINNYYFIGVGGTGMSALALYLAEEGNNVSGSDRSFSVQHPTDVQQKLSKAGILCLPQHGNSIPIGTQLVVASTAVEDTVPDLIAANERHIPIIKRSELLALISKTKKTIAIAGTSGKSTTAAMVFHILQHVGLQPSVITGAGLTSLVKKGLIGNAKNDNGEWLVIEADESDGSIVQYHPEIGVLLNVDKDHQDIEELMQLFNIFKTNSKNNFITNHSNVLAASLSEDRKSDFGKGTEFDGSNFFQDGLTSSFYINEQVVQLNMPGRHNMENALAAIAACNLIGVRIGAAAEALQSFEGIYRRHQLLGKKNGVWVVDDYAHNPAKCAASIRACQQDGIKLIAWFQPHGYTPTKFLKDDFIKEIAAALRPEDEIWMSEIYYAGGTAVKDISAKDLTDEITAIGKQAFFVKDRNELLQNIRPHFTENCMLLLMGARDPSLEDFAKNIFDSI